MFLIDSCEEDLQGPDGVFRLPIPGDLSELIAARLDTIRQSRASSTHLHHGGPPLRYAGNYPGFAVTDSICYMIGIGGPRPPSHLGWECTGQDRPSRHKFFFGEDRFHRFTCSNGGIEACYHEM
jgi:hypothetical protein